MEHNYSGIYTDCRNILKDYLDLKYSAGKRVHDEIIAKILDCEGVSEYYIHLVDAILCNKSLMIVYDGMFEGINKVYLLDKVSKTVKSFSTSSKHFKRRYRVMSE